MRFMQWLAVHYISCRKSCSISWKQITRRGIKMHDRGALGDSGAWQVGVVGYAAEVSMAGMCHQWLFK